MGGLWRRFNWLLAFLTGVLGPPALISLLWIIDLVPIIGILPAIMGSPVLVGLITFILASGLLASIALVRWIVRRKGGREFAAALLFCFGVVASIYPSLFVAYVGKQLLARHLADRGDRIVHAIDRYIDQAKHPPESLSDLVPEFLPAVPTTGSTRYAEYIYRVGSDAAEGNPWSLEIEMFEILKWDVLYYCPKQNCAGMSGGGTIQMGRWVFLDE